MNYWPQLIPALGVLLGGALTILGGWWSGRTERRAEASMEQQRVRRASIDTALAAAESLRGVLSQSTSLEVLKQAKSALEVAVARIDDDDAREAVAAWAETCMRYAQREVGSRVEDRAWAKAIKHLGERWQQGPG